MDDLKLNDRVQYIDNSNCIFEGTVKELFFKKQSRTNYFSNRIEYYDYLDKVKVDWDDGESVIEKVYELSKLDSELERDFRKSAQLILLEIRKHIDNASKSISLAEKISEEHGIPFSSSASPLGQDYIPESLATKYPDISCDVIESVTGVSPYDYSGWRHSSVC